MTDEDRRKKLKFRAWRRGFREMDLLIGSFADTAIDSMDTAGLDEFERLLGVPDWEVYAWLIGQKDVPDNHRGPVLDQLIALPCASVMVIMVLLKLALMWATPLVMFLRSRRRRRLGSRAMWNTYP